VPDRDRAPDRSRHRSDQPPARLCDWCCREFTRHIEVFWVASTVGYDERGEPYTGANTRMLLCHRCAPSFTRILRRAWNRESDRIAGRNLRDMPDLRAGRKGVKENGDVEALPIADDGEGDGVSRVEGPDTDNKG
jgi:hypothetical protein